MPKKQHPVSTSDDEPDELAPLLEIEKGSLFERALIWASELPWWAIILAIAIVSILYAMSTSIAYEEATRWLTDNPQSHTTDLFNVVQVVGEPTMITGWFEGETGDTVSTVINQLIKNDIDSELVRRSGFLEREDPATLTLRTDEGETIQVRKDYIADEQREETADGVRITVDYVDRVTVTGTLVERNDDTMRIRTVNEEIVTIKKANIISQTTADDGRVTFQRRGDELKASLTTLSNTTMNVQYENGTTAEFRLNALEWYHLPTLTIAVNTEANARPIVPGDVVRVGYIEGTDVIKALDTLDDLDDVPVSLRYTDGKVSVMLVPYPDIDSAMNAASAAEVDGVLYLDDSAARFDVANWVADHPDAGVSLPTPPRECTRSCTVTYKLLDDEVTGVIVEETDDAYRVQTVAPQYVVIDRDKIIENKRMEPGVCALNNLRGCNTGIFLTLSVTFQAYALALVIGLIVGLMRVPSKPTSLPARWINTAIKTISTLYVEIVRGIPLLVILLYAGFVISPRLRDGLGLNLSDTQEAVLGLAFGYGAFIAEIFRAGIQSIGRGQMEAARSLGMSYPQAMRHVILPQAVRVVLPPLGNDFIAMLKDSALISVLALPDLLQLGRLYVSRTFRAFEGYNTVAVMYLMMTLFLSLMVRVIERRTRLPQ